MGCDAERRKKVVEVVVVVVVVAAAAAAPVVDLQHYYGSPYMPARLKYYKVFNEPKTSFQNLLP